jgi:hypothetical protein
MVNIVSAAASFTRLSPVRMAITRFGSPSRRPIATAVTASGGATTAPRMMAVEKVSAGTIQAAKAPTTKAVTITRPTPRPMMGRRLRTNEKNEKLSAAE